MSPRLSRWTALLLGMVVLAGCHPRYQPGNSENAPPFVFRSLDLRQQDAMGRPLWAISSPEARYDLRRRLAQASDLRGTIYRDGRPRYRVHASSGIVINDGEVVQLEGTIRLEQIDDPPALITASRIRWLPSRQLMELDRHPNAYDDQQRLSARTARFRFDKERLELSGEPLLQRWPQPFNPLRSLPRGAPEWQVKVQQIVWFPRSGRLIANGPVQALRQARAGQPAPASAAPNGGGILPAGPGRQEITAAGLVGSTVSQRFRLLPPVRLLDQALAATLTAPGLTIDLRRQDASTDDGEAGCRIERPGETLQARRCRWNWSSQSVQATGAVMLKRQAQDQSSQASQLDARLGQPGSLVLTAPGSRVISRFRAPAVATPPPPPARPAPEPIHL